MTSSSARARRRGGPASRPADDARLIDLVREHARVLSAAGVPNAEHDAMALARHSLGLTTAGLRTAPLPAADDRAALQALVERRAAREPLQHLTGETWFRYLRLACRPGVFVPRPETEIVTGLAVDAARAAPRAPRVVEPCTGTGAIGLSVAVEVRGAQVTATDRDPAAVALARENLDHVLAGRADVEGLAAGAQFEVREGDLLDPIDPAEQGRVDVLVGNPPYLPRADRRSLPAEVRDHDPDRALFGGEDGLEIVDALLEAATIWLRPGGRLVLEIDERREEDVVARARAVGLAGVHTERDLTGAVRVLVATRPDAEETA